MRPIGPIGPIFRGGGQGGVAAVCAVVGPTSCALLNRHIGVGTGLTRWATHIDWDFTSFHFVFGRARVAVPCGGGFLDPVAPLCAGGGGGRRASGGASPGGRAASPGAGGAEFGAHLIRVPNDLATVASFHTTGGAAVGDGFPIGGPHRISIGVANTGLFLHNFPTLPGWACGGLRAGGGCARFRCGVRLARGRNIGPRAPGVGGAIQSLLLQNLSHLATGARRGLGAGLGNAHISWRHRGCGGHGLRVGAAGVGRGRPGAPLQGGASRCTAGANARAALGDGASGAAGAREGLVFALGRAHARLQLVGAEGVLFSTEAERDAGGGRGIALRGQ